MGKHGRCEEQIEISKHSAVYALAAMEGLAYERIQNVKDARRTGTGVTSAEESLRFAVQTYLASAYEIAVRVGDDLAREVSEITQQALEVLLEEWTPDNGFESYAEHSLTHDRIGLVHDE